jgi:predicted alpha/beta-hydrolase family hydrolase
MTHPFMQAAAEGLGRRGVAVLRYQFPFMEAGSRRPDRPPLAQATVRAAVACAAAAMPGVRLFAGGKSFGGRMTSGAEAAQAMGVAGLVFLGFPLHPAGKPGVERAAHLASVGVPMLFVQGSRDALAHLVLMRGVVEGLGGLGRLAVLDGADHSLVVKRRPEVFEAALDEVAGFIAGRFVAGGSISGGQPAG